MKSIILGSAAAVLAVTGAQAADLPAAEPVEYVKVCDTFGTGFFYIPGTETCLKIGGYARYELAYREPIDRLIAMKTR
ncbi:MAG: porin [Hyphomicrobiales bacterium]